MPDVIIQNPVINSPFSEPARHFEFGERGITGQIIDGARRESSYFVPIPAGRRQTASSPSRRSGPRIGSGPTSW